MARPRLSLKARQIIKRIRGELKAYGIRLRFHKGCTIKADGDDCSGYFDPVKLVLALANKDDEAKFMAVLYHEHIHFQQWLAFVLGRRNKLARAWRRSLETDAMGAKGLSRSERYEAYRALLELERQAEVGAIRHLEEAEIGTIEDRERLAKEAAIYLYCHRLMYEKRRWFKEGALPLAEWLNDPEIWRECPSKLRGINFNRIPPKLKKLLLRLF